MAKTRAQRKAERRAREAEEQKRSGGHESPAQAQHDTQVPISGDEALVEARELGMAAGASEESLRLPEETSRGGRRAEKRAAKEAEKRKRDEQKRRERQQLDKKQKQAKAERQRSGFIGFLISCWQELKKVQWPDRETLIQATAVTILFVAVAAAYLGALDAAFSWLIKQIL
ncbi:MAG TPA: preprotein translocase subunit SecE [Solirubrobacterales bacterium]|jgi:preprotein translocase subunit SecE|nr:preprotein translocase subunit SecE [Solirubrobacterales bacterium]